jgi:ankyrin repeat protein
VAKLIAASCGVNPVCDDDGSTPLHAAAYNGHAVVVTQLIAAGSNVDIALKTNGATPLHMAAQEGHESVTNRLIEARCNVDLALKTNGATPLFTAAKKGHTAIVKQLIGARCNVDLQTNSGVTPLYIAAYRGHASVTKQLIEARCNIDHQNKHGATPLFVASKKGHTEILEQLIAARCNVHLSLKNGLTAISIATRNGHTHIMTMIQNCLHDKHKFSKKDMSPSLTTKLGTRFHAPALPVKPCLRSTKMLTKHITVTFYNDPHADSIFVTPSTSIKSSVSANFSHVGSRFKETKPIPSSEHIFIIYMPTSFKYHFEQWQVDVHQNRLTKRKERKTMSRWPITYDTTTEKHTWTHQNNKTLSQRLADKYRFITLATEDATFRAIALNERLHVTFPGAVLDTGANKI